MQPQIIKTADGSHSLYVKDLNEHYHSVHGAIQEARHVFMKMGLQHLYDKNYRRINILEIGFGTGLNTLLCCLEADKLNVRINYSSLEAFPLEQKLLDELNYVELISVNEQTPDQVRDGHKEKNIRQNFQLIHSSEWEKQNRITENFSLHKIKNTLQEVEFENTFDLIFFDAFGPRVQPEMWTEKIFSKIFEAANANGCLVTYCAKGEVKRTVKKVGFTLETLQGPPGKREMIRGTKN